MTADEIWRPVVENQKYEVSNLGRVRNRETGYIKSPRRSKNGYWITELSGRTRYVHRLVAFAFVDNPKGYPHINHKDEDKGNNCADNLEWCTPAYNNHYGNHIELMANTKRDRYGKRIRQVDPMSGTVVAEYRSMTEAAEDHNVTVQAIYWALLKPTHTACGYRWEVVE